MLAAALALSLAALPCPRGFEPLDGDACLAAPKLARADRLLVYFHGILTSAQWEKAPEFQVLRAEATRRGYALLAMRGEQGLCNWSEAARGWWCWPTDLSQGPEVSRTLERVAQRLSSASARLELRFDPPCFAGFSNGGFFLALALSEGPTQARAVAVLHGGNVTGQHFTPEGKLPVLLQAASRDKIQLPRMRLLARLLEDAGWTPQLQVRPGDHEVVAADAVALLDFCAANPSR